MSDQQKVTGAWLSPDRTKIIIQVDGDQLTQIEPDSDDFASRVLDVPHDYNTLTTETQDWP